MPDGSTFEVTVSWTPETCAFQAYEALGTDPLLREALRQRVMFLEVEATHALDERLADTVAQWQECLGGHQASVADLLRVLDDRYVAQEFANSRSAACLSGEIATDAVQARAEIELALANQNREIVEAWIDVLERDAAAISD